MSKPSLAPRVSRNFVVQEIVISSLNNEWQGEAKVHANARIRNTYSDCVRGCIYTPISIHTIYSKTNYSSLVIQKFSFLNTGNIIFPFSLLYTKETKYRAQDDVKKKKTKRK